MIYWIGLVKHGFRVSVLALAIAIQLKLPVNKVKNIMVAGLLHDIGKLKLKYEILNKKGRLVELEYEHVKSHANFGAEILKGLHFSEDVVTIVRQHHESMDGSGYPDALKDDEIDIGSRILKVVDVYDALVSNSKR